MHVICTPLAAHYYNRYLSNIFPLVIRGLHDFIHNPTVVTLLIMSDKHEEYYQELLEFAYGVAEQVFALYIFILTQ